MKKAKPYRMKRIGILNPYGDIWSPETFDSKERAKAYVETYWRGVKNVNLRRYRYVPVRVTVSAVQS